MSCISAVALDSGSIWGAYDSKQLDQNIDLRFSEEDEVYEQQLPSP
jgi:hypothetical protein